ncbi:MAG: SUMF1/EgtB/PvdO family nonheme iron enzyme [Chloroflexi bacterium]|nr:SUMF1/EgtB/PvdO family nonheme iron enzyme [Chloroflexota bacterium]
MGMRKAFLSSTFKDLASYRDAVYRAIEQMDGWHCVRAEDFGARDWEADEFCRQKVAECDLFIGILGLLYGSIHQPSGLSYTEREYEAAVAASKPRLMFLTPEDFPVPGNLMEGSRKQRKQRAFRQRVSVERIRESDWTTPDQLARSVVIAIRNWEKQPSQETPSPAPTCSHIPDRQSALLRYLRYLRRACNALPLAALSEEADPHRQAEITLDRVYIELDTLTQVPLTEEQKHELRKFPWVTSRPLSALEAAADNNNKQLVILGDPGSGKSSFVNYLVYSLVAAYLEKRTLSDKWPHGFLVPVRVILRELAATLPLEDQLAGLSANERDRVLCETIRAYIARLLTACEADEAMPIIRDALDQGKSLVIFDGLDEVSLNQRRLTRQAVEAFVHYYPDNRFLVTCRIRSYQGEARLRAFNDVTLAPFDEPKIKAFVTAWYQALADLGQMMQNDAEKRAQNLWQAVQALTELARNPLLLTTMAVVHTAQVELPRERAKLYQRCVEVLLRRWHKHKAGEVPILTELGVSESVLLSALWEVAYAAHAMGKPGEAADLPRSQVLSILAQYMGDDYGKAQRFLQHVDDRAGLLVGQGGVDEPVYTFPHRTFQEFLAGCHLALGGRDFGRRLRGLLTGGDHWTLAARLGAEHLLYNVGDITRVLDALYTLCPVAEPRSEADWRGVLWAGDFAAEIGVERVRADIENPDGGPTFLERLVPRLVSILEKGLLTPLEREEAGTALAHLGDPRRGVRLLPDGLPDIVWCEVPAGPFLMGSDAQKDPQAFRGEFPLHVEESIAHPYFISRYPITNAQFAVFVQAGGYQERGYWREAEAVGVWKGGKVKAWNDDEPRDRPFDYGAPFNLPNHPIVGVTWYEALAFCRWLTEKLQEMGGPLQVWRNGRVETSILDAGSLVVRLPTEAEWEKAARSTDGRIYPWGNDFDSGRCNMAESGIGSTSAVGIFPGGDSPYGCADMAGNVWEWCSTKWAENYQGYEKDRVKREDLRGEDLRVLRGGSWGSDRNSVRCAFRDRDDPYYRYSGIGFRVVGASCSP